MHRELAEPIQGGREHGKDKRAHSTAEHGGGSVGERYAPVPKKTAPIAPGGTGQLATAAALPASTSTTAAPGLLDTGMLPAGVQSAAEVAAGAEAAALAIQAAATVGAATGSANVTGAVQALEAPVEPAHLAQPPFVQPPAAPAPHAQPPIAPTPAALPTSDDAGLFDGGKPRVAPLEFLKLNNIEPTVLSPFQSNENPED
jgi:hypothetical protein